ncbi:hypothetical protein DPMN_127634, partial [Dreissena polymorpha]
MGLTVLLLYVCGLITPAVVIAQSCPLQWRAFEQSCYLFYNQDWLNYTAALAHCFSFGSVLVSVNSVAEHNFIVQHLNNHAIHGDTYYTSGAVDPFRDPWRIQWQGDGSHVNTVLEDTRWLSIADANLSQPRLIYKTSGLRYGWSKSPSTVKMLLICEIPVLESYRVNLDQRDITYGTNFSDVRVAPHGPFFTAQPRNLVVISDSATNAEGDKFAISLECVADSIPPPAYRMIQTRDDGTKVIITSDNDSRYTMNGGRLVIQNPEARLDAGVYQCQASNQFGTIYSDLGNITFGVLEQFPNVIRAPVVAMEYQSAVIECSPPQFRPAVTYQWYRKDRSDFLRPDLNPHIFISRNGKLYFSEVTQTDEANYFCIVKLTSGNDPMSTAQPPSRISLPTSLQIKNSVPAMWGPVIADGFIASHPNKPLRGQDVALECFAYGTLPMTYSWSRKDASLPQGAALSDHNRKLELYDVTLEDSGIYYCHVTRTSGQTALAAHNLMVESSPYFVFPLSDLHVDAGSRFSWSCEAKAIPRAVYVWYKDGETLHPVEGDIAVQANVLTIFRAHASLHDGMYQCVAINSHGIAHSSAQLRVLAFAPTFVKKPLKPSTSAAIGGHVTIECSPEAAPKPEVTWTRNGITVNAVPDDGMSRVRLRGNGGLHIAEVQTGDAGLYCCVVTNAHGSDTSCGEFKVVQRTVLLSPPNDVRANVNTTATLNCEASFPVSADSLYGWKFNGRDIKPANSSHYVVGTRQSPGSLYVIQAQYEHSGLYTCVAQTTHDSVNASALLAVEGPPGAPAGVYVGAIVNTSATVYWTEGDRHGRDLQYHTIEASNEHNALWVTVASYIPVASSIVPATDRRHGFIVSHLKPGNNYYFRVKAMNALGVGAASQRSMTYRIPAASPPIYPRNIGGGGGSVGLLTITWEPLPSEDQGSTGVGYRVLWRRANTTRYSEANLTDNVGQHVVTVGVDNYYLLYEVKVAAYNNMGPGPMSPDGVFIYSAEEIAKGVVTNLYAWPYNSTAIQVTWDIVPNIREFMGGTLMGYQINFKVRFDPNAGWDAISWRGETSHGVVIGLTPYTWYSVDMQVLNTAGMGPRSEMFHARTFKD